ncbi:MAG: hypothetical protein JSR48_00280 [Verrucomicrobia bacterium]|nr:hypothetical protein [Verrucomicrobiota bacterium]
MTVTVTCTGTEVFAGYTPGSPWGAVGFLNDPVLELHDGSGTVVAQQVLGGVAADWLDGGSRTATVSFTAAAGTYSLVGVTGTRLQLIPGDGWTGWRLAFGAIPDPAGTNSGPAISWTSTPGGVASGAAYVISAHGHDADGNLAQVNIWKDGVPFAFAGGGDGTDGDAGNPSGDAGPATITFTAQAVDALGAVSALISQTVTVGAPAPVQYTLTTNAGAGGSVSAGGTWDAGTVVTVTATPDATHDFAGWSGDVAGLANPVSLTLDRDRTVQANFSAKQFALVTGASAGGSVTPGGTFPYGTSVAVSATPDATHRFAGWSGDASGVSPGIVVTVLGPMSVQAVFVPKSAQIVMFPAVGDHAVGGPPVTLGASASSGLPVTYVVLDGPATVVGDQLQVTGAGVITIQANQTGDATYLPATAVAQSFNGVAAAILRYRPAARVILQGRRQPATAPFVVQVP